MGSERAALDSRTDTQSVSYCERWTSSHLYGLRQHPFSGSALAALKPAAALAIECAGGRAAFN